MDITTPPVCDNRDRYGIIAWLQQIYRAFVRRTAITTQTTTYTVPDNVFHTRADATSGAFTVTIPSALTTAGRQILITKIDASANAITVAAAGTDTIQGSATISLAAQWNKALLISNGNNGWERIV